MISVVNVPKLKPRGMREEKQGQVPSNNAFETDAIAGVAALCQRAAQLGR
jgi:hypothetical protein